MGPRRGQIRNCELVVADDTSDSQDAGADITLAWTNAGLRTGGRIGRGTGGSLARTDAARLKVNLTSGDDRYDQTTPIHLIPAPPGLGGGFAINLGAIGKTGLLVFGKAGDDVIFAWEGSDHLEGEAGNDTLRGRGGDDLLFGRIGDDVILGDEGADLLEGGRGRDRLDGGAGNDTITGGYDADTLAGGPGRDRLVAVDGTRDVVDCGPGRDTALVDRRDRVRGCERIERR